MPTSRQPYYTAQTGPKIKKLYSPVRFSLARADKTPGACVIFSCKMYGVQRDRSRTKLRTKETGVGREGGRWGGGGGKVKTR